LTNETHKEEQLSLLLCEAIEKALKEEETSANAAAASCT
jgi:hypothetical protein